MGVFRWALNEMDRRYEMFEHAGSRDLGSYNKKNPKDTLPYVVIVVDELADLMSTYGKEVEGSIVRIAQMARATGIHLILSTQRPSVEVVTGLIKANIPARIALQVASQIDSRTILDMSGAEKLLGGGDMLIMTNDKPKRIQGAFVAEEEIQKVAEFIKQNNRDIIGEEVSFDAKPASEGEDAADPFDSFSGGDDEDDLLEQAIEVVVQAEKASASLLQRRLKVGYARAARLLDIMEEKGIIGPSKGANPREVYLKQ
jgi:S-DNA-T family DNA segregation ATPase FtsK/SpoIIIE